MPVWAEIVPETFTDNDLETQTGEKVVNTVYSPMLWFGPDSRPPTTLPPPQKAAPPPAVKEEIAISCNDHLSAATTLF